MLAAALAVPDSAEAARRHVRPHRAARQADPAPSNAPIPGDPAALGGYNLMIADRGNNRVLIVSPEKKILWEYQFEGIPLGSAADDTFFTLDHKAVVASMEYWQLIQIIDIATKKVTWSYGHPGKKGSADGFMNFPDDAYQLPNGNIMVADIRNCRVIEINSDHKIARQAGKTGACYGKWPQLGGPNGDTPLPNGHVLVSEIINKSVTELDEKWQKVMSVRVPLQYPSDPQPTKSGNILIADYVRPGKIIEITRDGHVLWQYDEKTADGFLHHPSLAEELPNGNIMANDDYNHRIVIIDRATKKIIWQYGHTRQPGKAEGYLNIPDGMDIIKASDFKVN